MNGSPVLCPPPNRLQQFLNETLESNVAHEIDTHLSHCGKCQQAIEQFITAHDSPSSPQMASALSDELPPDIPGFLILRRIATGGMGVLWCAVDQQFGRTLALKIMKLAMLQNPYALRRFTQEWQLCSRLAHPFIVPVHSCGQLSDGRPFYTMKLVEGETLSQRLKQGTDPQQHLLQIFHHVCQAVAFAHSRQVIHRDLTPNNIMVGEHGEVQLMDWGLAKVLRMSASCDLKLTLPAESWMTSEAMDGSATEFGHVMGTYAYMAPEQARGLPWQVDRATDVFALGAILCEILTGVPPYQNSGERSLKEQATDAALGDAFQRLRRSGSDPELIQLAMRCLSVERALRPSDARIVANEMAMHLARAEDRLQNMRIEHERERVRTLEKRKRTRVTAALLSVIAIAALAVTGIWLYRAHQQNFRAQLPLIVKAHLSDAQAALGDQDSAMLEEAYQNAAAALTQLVEWEPDEVSYRIQLAGLFSRWGNDLMALGESSQAIVAYQQSCAMRETIVDLAANVKEHWLGLAHARGILAAAMLRLDMTGAEDAFLAAESALHHPQNPTKLEDLNQHHSVLLLRWAAAHESIGKESQAREFVERAHGLCGEPDKMEHLQLGVPGWRKINVP